MEKKDEDIIAIIMIIAWTLVFIIGIALFPGQPEI
jgi:hypothetical protein